MAGDNDLNAVGSFRFAALTSRLGVDVKGYRFGGWDMGAKIETDFYAASAESPEPRSSACVRLRDLWL